MAESNTTETLKLDFGNGAPSASKPCCNKVKGEWKVIPKPTLNDVDYLGPGDITTRYYLDSIPYGYRVTGRFLAKGRIKGTLVCKCEDDGRTMSETAVDEPIQFETKIPVFQQNLLKRAIPGIGWYMLAIDAAKAAKKAYDIYNLSPELSKKILENAGPAVSRAVEEIKNSADTLCQNKHKQKCAPEKPADPGPPGPPGKYDGVPMV